MHGKAGGHYSWALLPIGKPWPWPLDTLTMLNVWSHNHCCFLYGQGVYLGPLKKNLETTLLAERVPAEYLVPLYLGIFCYCACAIYL